MANSRDPVVFLDSGAILDFEEEIYKRWRLSDSKNARPSAFYEHLTRNGFPIFVTESVLHELTPHYENHRINGNSELSGETFDVIKSLHSKYCDFMKNVMGNGLDSELARYHTYMASLLAFEEGHKKQCRDKMSRTDRELIASALWARYTYVPFGNFGSSKLISSSIILSPDCHIKGTCDVLTRQKTFKYQGQNVIPFGYIGLRVINTREDHD